MTTSKSCCWVTTITSPSLSQNGLLTRLLAYLFAYLLAYLNLVVYLLTYILRMCERWEGRTPKEERPILHDDVGRWTRHCTLLTFRIIGGGGDSLPGG